MDNNVVINQLEKALKSKDDKELRLRVEVLVDMLKESRPRVPQIPQISQMPQPQTRKAPAPKGPGAIVSNGEQLTYTRPEGT